MSDPARLANRMLPDVTITFQLAGRVHVPERHLWEASLVRFLLETPGSIQDWADMPADERWALVVAEQEHDTDERRALVAHAMAILRGEG